MRTYIPVVFAALAAFAACVGDDHPQSPGPGTPFAGGAESPLPTPHNVVPDCTQALPPSAVSPGERHTVAGTIASVDTAKDARGGMTLLEFADEGGRLPVAIAIASGAREAFPPQIDQLYVGKDVCVNGVVIEVGDRRVLFVDGPSEIVMQ